jgi:hypothetical protein
MSSIADILAKYLKMAPADAQRLSNELTRLEAISNDLGRSIGKAGSVKNLTAGNVNLNSGTGLRVYDPSTGFITVEIQPDGDVWIGHNISELIDPTKAGDVFGLTLGIFSNDQTFRGEDFGKGDLLIGDNQGMNAHYDASTGLLEFRDGTTVRAYIGSDGKLYAGSGTHVFDEGGYAITDTVNDVRQISWYYNGTNLVGGIFGDYGSGVNAEMWLRASHQSGDDWDYAGVIMQAVDPDASVDARIWLRSDKGVYVTGVDTFNIEASGGDGNLNVEGAYKQNGDQLLTARQTGWTAPTGTLSRDTFDQSTVTLPELAKRLAALITDLTTHGLIGT